MVESKLVSSLRINQKGQGMIEYLLLLVITISMILLAMTNLFKPMQKFMNDFMGTYVACLLSSGELPAIRSENALKDAEPKCDFSFTGGNAKFTNNSGAKNGNNSSGNNGNNDGSDKGSDGANNNGKDGKDRDGNGSRDGSDLDGNGRSGNNSYAGSRSRRSGFGAGGSYARRSSDSEGDGDDMAGGGGKRYVNNLDRNSNDRFFKGQQRSGQNNTRNGRAIMMGGLTEDEQKKIERKIQSTPRNVPKSSEEFSVPAKKNVLKPPPPKEAKITDEKEEPFTIGNFLKYIIIAVILLLILILGGGQAFEMSKSMD